MYLEQIEGLNARVAELDVRMRCTAKKAELVRRAQTMPVVRPVTELAIETLHLILQHSDAEVIMPPSLGLCRSNTQPAASNRISPPKPRRNEDALFKTAWSAALHA